MADIILAFLLGLCVAAIAFRLVVAHWVRTRFPSFDRAHRKAVVDDLLSVTRFGEARNG